VTPPGAPQHQAPAAIVVEIQPGQLQPTR
jgi:hypothetical protein